MKERSKSFCLFPWIHNYITPEGNVHPCCTADLSKPLENIQETGNSVKDIALKNTRLSEIRQMMLNNEYPEECKTCWNWEAKGAGSFRTYANDYFKEKIDHYIENTNPDGTLKIYEPLYVDIRFSNICNFKCRSCGDTFSSSWAKERREFEGSNQPILKKADKDGKILNEMLEYLDTVELIYWGGGEPLLMDEHYIILEELIKRKRFDVFLRYNSNTSILKFKNRSFIDLIKQFHKVEIQSSIDHYGMRAEWLRHGTKWDEITENIKEIKKLPNVKWCMNTVITKWNLCTLDEFYRYMIDAGLYTQTDSYYTSSPITPDPRFYSVETLPQEFINESTEKIKKLIEELNQINYNASYLVNAVRQLENTKSIYGSAIEKKGIEIADHIDQRRNENWREVFPELASL